MQLTRITTAKKHGFSIRTIHKKAKRKRIFGKKRGYLKEKSSFLIAVFSLIAFVAGNMMGQLGWHAFLASFAHSDDSLILYTGTVTPLEKVPDYVKWAAYGGNPHEHTFRQVPKDVLVAMPAYVETEQRRENAPGDLYSTGHMGDYESGAEGEGSHVGVDIRTPVGTPVRSIAAGIVEDVRDDTYGFGKLIVIRHPHMPNPANPKKEIVLYSSYAHLSAQYVEKGQILKKGDEIGLTGMTGFATGPHLHFQIDLETAPFHPYWPFTSSEAKSAGLTYMQALNSGFHQERGYEFTLNPMLVVQANLPAVEPSKTKAVATKSVSSKRPANIATLRDRRREQRLGTTMTPTSTVLVSGPAPVEMPAAAASSSVAAASSKAAPSPVASLEIQHDRSFIGREWETVRITLLDATGKSLPPSALTQPLYLRTAYGEAEFDPPVLKQSDFGTDGMAQVKMLPVGRRTVHVLVEPLGVMGPAMEYKGS